MGIYGNYLLETITFWNFKSLYKEAIKTQNPNRAQTARDMYSQEYYKMKPDEDKKARKMCNELDEIIKKSKKTIRKNNSYRDLDDDYKEEIENILKKIVNKYNNDPEVKNKLKELKTSKLICDVFEDLEDEISFEICDDDQETRIKLLSVIDDIASDLKKELKNPGLNISTGDGDEGCIYITY